MRRLPPDAATQRTVGLLRVVFVGRRRELDLVVARHGYPAGRRPAARGGRFSRSRSPDRACALALSRGRTRRDARARRAVPRAAGEEAGACTAPADRSCRLRGSHWRHPRAEWHTTAHHRDPHPPTPACASAPKKKKLGRRADFDRPTVSVCARAVSERAAKKNPIIPYASAGPRLFFLFRGPARRAGLGSEGGRGRGRWAGVGEAGGGLRGRRADRTGEDAC